MTTINADDVRIPRRVRDALDRHEEVVVLNRNRPVYVLSNADDRRRAAGLLGNGRPLREAVTILAAAPLPDDLLGSDLEDIRRSTGPNPVDPWEQS